MSRHRDVRSMNFSDEYDGYDDVYGHSIEDDYCVSPSAEQFMFDRNKQQNISSFFTAPDIQEGDESVEDDAETESKKDDLSETDKAKLASCLETIRSIVGETVSEGKLRKRILESHFNVEQVLDSILNEDSPVTIMEPQMADEEIIKGHTDVSKTDTGPATFTIPKLSFKKKSIEPSSNFSPSLSSTPTSFNTDLFSLSSMISKTSESPDPTSNPVDSKQSTSFGTLADLTAHHLEKSNSPKISSRILTPKFSMKQKKSEETEFTIPKLSFQKPSTKVELFSEENGPSGTQESKDSTVEASEEPIEAPKTVNLVDWVIDLRAALKQSVSTEDDDMEVEVSVSEEVVDEEAASKKVPREEEEASSDFVLDLSVERRNLIRRRIPYSNKEVSLFGKIVCKKWKSSRPSVPLSYEKTYKSNVKPFNFSTPSPDTKILTYLKRLRGERL